MTFKSLIYTFSWVAALFGIGVVMMAGSLTERYRQAGIDDHRALIFSDVYVHHGDQKIGIPFHPGDFFFAHYKVKRLRTCTVTIQFRLTMVRPGDRYTGLFSFSYPRASYYGPPADLETNEYMQIPTGMPPGKYELRRQNFIRCDEKDQWVEQAPPALLEILERKELPAPKSINSKPG